MTEASLSKWLSKARSPTLQLTRIENSVSAGFADVFGYCKYRGAFFIELKQCPKPKKLKSKLLFKIRQSQIVWHREMAALEAKSWILIKIGSERHLISSVYVEACRHLTIDNPCLINVTHLSPSKLIDFILK
jgi:hypothetical protein